MTSHWAGLAERGASWGLRFLACVYRTAGQRCCLAALLPIVCYFHLSGAEQRGASRRYLKRVFAARGQTRAPGRLASFKHSMDFARKALETFAAWPAADHLDIPRIFEGDPVQLFAV